LSRRLERSSGENGMSCHTAPASPNHRRFRAGLTYDNRAASHCKKKKVIFLASTQAKAGSRCSARPPLDSAIDPRSPQTAGGRRQRNVVVPSDLPEQG
jgi:hypothetical protein